MGIDSCLEAQAYRDATEHLQETFWGHSLSNDPHFANSYPRNYDVRRNRSHIEYIRNLMNSEMERRVLIEEVLPPHFEYLATP